MNTTESIEERSLSSDVYIFSYHAPDPKMVEDLGGKITTRFKGTISNIQRQGDKITFTETLFLGGQQLKCCHFISAKSIVVVEDPISEQNAWLQAGVATLLVPQMHQERDNWGSIVEKYCGLVQVHQISVSTSVWHGCNSGLPPQVQQPVKSAQAEIADSHKKQNIPNLFNLLKCNQIKQAVFF